MNRKNSRGFSLIEMLITVAILAVVSAAAVSLMYQSQFIYTEQSQVADASQQLRAAMDQVVRVFRQAGSDPLATDAVPAVTVLGPGHVRVCSDLTGSVPSVTQESLESTGDPDGTLSSLGEIVTFRYDSDSEQLLMDMGLGEGVLAENVSAFNLSFFDSSGAATSVDQDIAFIEVSLTGRSEDASAQTGRHNAVSFSSEVFLRSQALAMNAPYSSPTSGDDGGSEGEVDDGNNGNDNGNGNSNGRGRGRNN